MHDRLAILQAEALQHAAHAVAAENAHQIVFEREEETAGTGIALATGAATQLVVDAAAFMALRADHEKPTGGLHLFMILGNLGTDVGRFFVTQADIGQNIGFLAQPHVQIAAEFDVGAAAGHVGGDGHRTRRASLRHDGRFLFMKTRIQHGVRNFAFLQDLAQNFALLDADRADQHRLQTRAGLFDQRGHGGVFLAGCAVDLIIFVAAGDRYVGGDFHDGELVDFGKLVGFGHRRAGHARKLREQAEIVLEGDRGESLVLLLHGDKFLRLQRLVQALGKAAAFHHAAGEFVDDHHLVVTHAHDRDIVRKFGRSARACRAAG